MAEVDPFSPSYKIQPGPPSFDAREPPSGGARAPRVATSPRVAPAAAAGGGGASPAKEVYDIKRLIWGEGGRTLPPGVNPGKLEAYLSDAQFAEVLGMPRPQFGALSAADQMHIKRNVGLF